MGTEKTKGFEFGNFKTDPEKEEDGVWYEYAPKFRLLIARMGNTKCQRLFEKREKPYMHRIRQGELDEDTAMEILIETLAETVLLGWEGLLSGGEPIPYSKEKARELLAVRDFRAVVLEFAKDGDNFREDIQEESAKN